MKTAIARGAMAIAVRSVGESRWEWASAMQAEFEIATDAGEPLSFAFGCLFGAWREMPHHEEGRFALASHVLAVGVILPLGALLLASVAAGSPLLVLGDAVADNVLGGGAAAFSVNEANEGGLPIMAALTLALGLGHLCMAWVALERDWARAAVMGRLAAAITITSAIFSGALFLTSTCALPETTVTASELIAVWTLARWHADLPVSRRRA